MSKWWLAFCKPFFDRMMSRAQKDPDVSYDDYKDLQKRYKDLYK
jgi:hypothetical protein